MLIEHADKARISEQLVMLREDAPLPVPVDALVLREPERAMLAAWLTAQGFRSTIAGSGWSVGAVRRRTPTAGGERPPVAAPPTVSFGAYEASPPWRRLRAWVARRRAAGCRRAGHGDRRAGRDARAIWSACRWRRAPGRACYVPLRHEVLGRADCRWRDGDAVLGPLLADPAVLKILQNAKFDMMMLARAGFPPVAPIDDTMLISYAQDAGAHGHGMDELSRLHLGHTPISLRRGHGDRAQPHQFRRRCRSTAPPPMPPRTPT